MDLIFREQYWNRVGVGKAFLEKMIIENRPDDHPR